MKNRLKDLRSKEFLLNLLEIIKIFNQQLITNYYEQIRINRCYRC